MTSKLKHKRMRDMATGLAIAMFAAVTSAQASEVGVRIDNFTFAPQEVTVKVGDTITWVNHDDIPHTVTSKTMSFRSQALDTDDTYSFTFMQPGTYPYFCSLHPMMTGSIVVQASAGK